MHEILVFALLALIVWRVYVRFKRMVGRQRLTKYRLWVQLSLFPTLVLLLAWSGMSKPESLAWLGTGLAVGGGLAVYGLKTTLFQPEPGKLYYTLNACLGVALSSLFVLRVGYRIYEVSAARAQLGVADFARSHFTLLAFGLLAGYYIAYAIGLARWRSRVLLAKQRRLGQEQGTA
ncbi:MAG: hypothetical protein AB3X44_19680 [Leptothrix sp. (in: b-proteobacteria)]